SECASSNLFAVIHGKLVTAPAGPKVLPGITRLVLLELAREMGIDAIERPIREAEARAAEELFITSTTRELSWVASWDGKPIGAARCGTITKRLHEVFLRRIAQETALAPAGHPM